MLVVMSVTGKMCFDRQYPFIPLENAVGDVSVRYVPEWMVGNTFDSFLSVNSDTELFERTNCIFSGTVSKIDYIKIIVGNQQFYYSIVTIQVDRLFEGVEMAEIKLLTPPIINNSKDSAAILHLLTEGSYGLFITANINNNQMVGINNSCLYLSDLVDSRIIDNYICVFLYEEKIDRFICYDTIHNHIDTFYDSLTAYDSASVYEYIEKMTNLE